MPKTKRNMLMVTTYEEIQRPVGIFTSERAMMKWAKQESVNEGLGEVTYQPWNNILYIHNDGFETAYSYNVYQV